jgi:hypothetical protein
MEGYNFFLAILTCIGTFFLFKKYLLKGKLFERITYLLLLIWLLVYSGLGIGLKDCSAEYALVYFIYLLFLRMGIGFVGSNKKLLKNNYKSAISYIISKSNLILIIYFLLIFSQLIYPVFKLDLLFSPPRSNLVDHFQNRFIVADGDVITTIRSLFIQLLTPFFYLSLYKYYKKDFRILLFLFIPTYINYCDNAYIGRGAIAMLLMFLFIFFYLKYPKKRKLLITSVAISAPILVSFFVFYSFYRQGLDYESTNIKNVYLFLVESEISYPLHFNSIKDHQTSFQSIFTYLYWMFTLPSPISLNFFGLDYGFNHIFTEYITGNYRGADTYSILLPGLVGESYFIFGKLFMLQAFLLGILLKIMYNYLSRADEFLFLKIFYIIMFSYNLSRGGSVSVIPLLLKQLLYFHIIIFLISNMRSNN